MDLTHLQAAVAAYTQAVIDVEAVVASTPSSASGLVSTSVSVAGNSGPNLPLDFAQATNAGTYIGVVTVTFTGGSSYTGTITISGAGATKFSLSPSSKVLSAAYPCNLYVAQADIAAGSYSISLTANP